MRPFANHPHSLVPAPALAALVPPVLLAGAGLGLPVAGVAQLSVPAMFEEHARRAWPRLATDTSPISPRQSSVAGPYEGSSDADGWDTVPGVPGPPQAHSSSSDGLGTAGFVGALAGLFLGGYVGFHTGADFDQCYEYASLCGIMTGAVIGSGFMSVLTTYAQNRGRGPLTRPLFQNLLVSAGILTVAFGALPEASVLSPFLHTWVAVRAQRDRPEGQLIETSAHRPDRL